MAVWRQNKLHSKCVNAFSLLDRKNDFKQNNFTHNPQAQYGIIGSNELSQNNTGFSSFDGVDEGFSNIDIMNTGINPNDAARFNDNVSDNVKDNWYDQVGIMII